MVMQVIMLVSTSYLLLDNPLEQIPATLLCTHMRPTFSARVNGVRSGRVMRRQKQSEALDGHEQKLSKQLKLSALMYFTQICYRLQKRHRQT